MEDNNRFLENERLQIEHIRELEMEELQIEEVEDTNNSSSDDDFISNHEDAGGAGEYGGFTFDMGLASMHTYLGEVEDTQRRVSFLDGGAILNLPMFYLEGVVLFPGATLPLRVTQPSLKAAVERALNQVDVPYTIGVVRVHRNPSDHRFCFANVGTTAEIRQYRRLEDGSLNVVTRGQQRFRLRRSWVDVDGVPCGEIQIIQEDLPLRTPRDAFGQLASVSNFWNRRLSYPVPVASCAKRYGHGDKDNDSETLSEASFESDLSPTELRIHLAAIDSCNKYDELINSDDESGGCKPNRLFGRYRHQDSGGSSKYSHNEKLSEIDIAALSSGNQSFLGRQSPRGGRKEWATASKHRASMLFWPHWVFRMYDSYCLSQRAADMWKQIIGVPSMDDLVKKPDLLSFYIASKIPVSESTRQELLEIDGISYRLRREIELLECFDRVRCKTCKSVIAKRSDMLVMSSDGPLGAYVNPHGFVHEIMTLYQANGLALIGRPVEEYSWFPGYAWTITICSTCETQMGWLFTAIKKKLKPKSFWGIRSSQVADDIR